MGCQQCRLAYQKSAVLPLLIGCAAVLQGAHSTILDVLQLKGHSDKLDMHDWKGHIADR